MNSFAGAADLRIKLMEADSPLEVEQLVEEYLSAVNINGQ